MRRLLPILVLLTTAAAVAQPQVPLATPYAIEGTTAYDPAIPTPQDVLGYTIGERHTRPDEVVRYVEAVAEASPRVTMDTPGRVAQVEVGLAKRTEAGVVGLARHDGVDQAPPLVRCPVNAHRDTWRCLCHGLHVADHFVGPCVSLADGVAQH
ncbi:MAG: hypothetical protein AAF791_12965, partial [Bacteroidota bacterium]